VSKPRPPFPAQSHAAVAGIDDVLLLLQLRAAQKQDRKAFEKRRRVALDRHLFQRGDSAKPTPEYGAFLLAIRKDPALLRWALDPGGKRHKPVLAGGDEAFQDRFATYMQHPAVQQQVTALLERAYEAGKPWPDELTHGMWRYEPGRYGHQSAVEARAGWAAEDARARRAVAPSDTPAPIIVCAGDLVVPDLRRVLRWGDADLVRLLYPSVQRELTILWREQQEERVEALVVIVDGTVSLERWLIPDGDTVRPTATASAVPPALAAAFARWQDDPDFYLDMALDSAAARAAVKRKANCSDPNRRAVEASRNAGDAPAIQRALTERLRDHERFASPHVHLLLTTRVWRHDARHGETVTSWSGPATRSQLHRGWIERLPLSMREAAISPYRTGNIAPATPDCSRLLALFGPRKPAPTRTPSSKPRRRRYRIRKTITLPS